eukprot:CAMPEP_0181343098 /NCGR_PEP_ID=MMETSP1101-20121128/31398_1 /TAXON_ID=46948 /ORGANISM="Rhodomonas abbreviata, Strain Caron Lab Isolate" /LENGTH=271 /DNA_ID=CAMNT_0023454691 /DNA_START=8 /DNA_END=824 /DNA_ORIENTATION=+
MSTNESNPGSGATMDDQVGEEKSTRKLRRITPVQEFAMKILQWAHTFLFFKMLFYIFVLDWGAQALIGIFSVIFLKMIVLDPLVDDSNRGISTFVSCCWLMRLSQEFQSTLLWVTKGLMLEAYVGFWATNFLCTGAVVGLAQHYSKQSLLVYFFSVVLWELLALPIGAFVATLHPEYDAHIKAKPFHQYWIIALFAAVLLRDIDPYTLAGGKTRPSADSPSASPGTRCSTEFPKAYKHLAQQRERKRSRQFTSDLLCCVDVFNCQPMHFTQ